MAVSLSSAALSLGFFTIVIGSMSACRNLDFATACSEDQSKCSDEDSSVDTGADVGGDAFDVATDTFADSVSATDSSDVADTPADVVDAACPGECTAGAHEEVAGSCTGYFERQVRRCSSTCRWDTPTCQIASGWHKITGLGEGRIRHSAVWTGTELLIWGGSSSDGLGTNFPVATGIRFNPVTNTWKLLADPPAAFAAREQHSAVWADGVMVIWGGKGSAGMLDDGAAYDPVKDTWALLPASPLAKRARHMATYSPASELMIVWGGRGATTDYADGASYSVKHSEWKPIPASPLAARSASVSAIVGTKIMYWGGVTGDNIDSPLSDACLFDPVGKSWGSVVAPAAGFVPRGFAVGAAAKNGLFVFGGGKSAAPDVISTSGGMTIDSAGSAELVSGSPGQVAAGFVVSTAWCDGVDRCWSWSDGSPAGGVYTLSTHTWSTLETAGSPSIRADAMATWTGSYAIIWGGSFNGNGRYPDGAMFVP